jgi:biopolymer transport protein ExbB/TolQ
MAGKSIFQIILMSGFVIWILVICSILAIAVIIERSIFFYRKNRLKRDAFMVKIRNEIKNKNFEKALGLCEGANSPLANVVREGIMARELSENKMKNAMDRQKVVETVMLEKFLNILGTIGSTAVYIGLLGTVIGIIRAFHDISSMGGGINTVIGGISEALFSTAAGIVVALIAVIAYNYFIKRSDDFSIEMELCSSETADLIKAEDK